jgi:hypothetical protein
MIVSHRHRFIFIKTLKTGGTSIEIALSRYCGPNDVITSLTPEDEDLRRRIGGRGPQNERVPYSSWTPLDWARALRYRKSLRFRRHWDAATIRSYLDPEVWSTYFKFCFERNPWEKVISGYYYRFQDREESALSLSEFILSGMANSLSDYDRYSIDGEVAVDQICRFERLDEEMVRLAEEIGLPEAPELPKAKSRYRKENTGRYQVLSGPERDKIAQVFAREITLLGYTW